MPTHDGPDEEHRRTRRLETGWRFTRGDVEDGADPALDDGDWERVEVPHDWSIEGPFDPDSPSQAAGGYAPEGVGWYRRELPEDIDGEPTLRFDGVYRDFDVYVDGEHVGNRPYGYSTVNYDLSEFGVTGGETLAVRVANDEHPHSRWYTGSGIYRDVHLTETDPVSVAPFGTDVRTNAVNRQRAEVQVLTEVTNDEGEAVTVALETDIVDADGEVVATAGDEATVDPGAAHEFEQRLSVADPERWTLDDPTRYFARSVVYREDGDGDEGDSAAVAVDDYVTPFGVRTFEWTADEGFFLNGEPVDMKGVNIHHDAGCLGAAVTERALERRLEALRELGCNAIRTAHNPPQPELLDLCDRMGFLVVDEVYDKWRHVGADEWFDEWWDEDLSAMIDRDRNHPSIVLWSVGNENFDQGSDEMIEDLAMLTEAASEMDPTRPVTYGNPPWGDGTEGVVENIERVAEHVDVLVGNYQEHWYDDYREAGIDLPILGSENRRFFRGSDDEPLAFVPRNPWYDVEERDDVCGQFLWPGIDYLGEARDWPSKGWPTGLIDTTGAIKPSGRFHQAAWSEEPVVFAAAVDHDRERPACRPAWSGPPLSEHWTFPDREDSQDFVNVYTYTNAEEVELYQNDEYLGTQHADDYGPRPIEWYVPYESGTLRAVAKEDGEVVDEHELETAGEPAAVDLSADRETLAADGRDLVYVEATVVDDEGVRVPRADHEVDFAVSGAGEIAGVDNGDLDSDEPWVGDARSAYHGTCIAVVRADREGGRVEVEVEAEADGLDGDGVTLPVGPDGD
ncbi:glycoside hydrolase family 2 TIM barrel-domain containing protein [Halosimplex pelagicum]|uniref:Glycoside hydrolase family 2 protein n=1 Tax=Halosimplex pelagicum TaxID=869886 RepID=A0A7D5TCF0_9EURY|nr:glycoside hydrolase family 2 TIM barrel-domain containing protein [Halosimplex pelagicum]QLH84550.1 glycoside hydrolase family 2 protein [Halosimplex pelagicum]